MNDLPFPTDLQSSQNFLLWCIGHFGGGFHPDTLGREYTEDLTGKDVFSEEQAEFFDQYMDAAFVQFDRAGLDVYEFCLQEVR